MDALVSTLNELVETCYDAHAGYQVAAKGVKDMKLKRLLGQFAFARKRFGEELRAEVQKRGAAAGKHGTVAGAFHRGWIQLKELGRAEPATILEECSRGEAASIRLYKEALSKDLPAEVRQTVALQLDQITADRERLLELRRSTVDPPDARKSPGA
jgi:uncharacterized protein (TIGR02284 family)